MTLPRMQKTGFEITCVADEKLGRKINVEKFEDTLNEHLQLSDYGNGIAKLFFVFLGVPISNEFHQGKIKYTAAEKHLEIALHLPYDDLVAANEEKAFELMCDLFIDVIEDMEEIPPTEDFDFNHLYRDALNLFY